MDEAKLAEIEAAWSAEGWTAFMNGAELQEAMEKQSGIDGLFHVVLGRIHQRVLGTLVPLVREVRRLRSEREALVAALRAARDRGPSSQEHEARRALYDSVIDMVVKGGSDAG